MAQQMMVVIDCNLENVLQDYDGGSVWTLPQDVRKFGMMGGKRGKSGRSWRAAGSCRRFHLTQGRGDTCPSLEPALTQEYGFTNLVIQIESQGMNKAKLLAYLEKIDQALTADTVLYIYGSAASILLDQPGRTSLDIDVAAPYSEAVESDLQNAAEKAGIPVNPLPEYNDNHIEWIGSLRLCLPPPRAEHSLTLWQGKKLVIKTGSVADLVASKLIRYDELAQGDIQYLLQAHPVSFANIKDAVKRLPSPFADDPMLLDNLASLEHDMRLWRDRHE